MKRILIVAGLFALLISLLSVSTVAGKVKEPKVVFESILIDSILTEGTASGQVTVWDDAQMKIQLVVDGVPVGQIYDIKMGYSFKTATGVVRLMADVGQITSGANGKALGYFNLTQLGITPGTRLAELGFLVISNGPVAATSFAIPYP